MRSDFRIFKVSRIGECRLTADNFTVRETPEVIPWDIGSENQGEQVEIVLEIDRSYQNKLPDFLTPYNCRISEDGIVARLKTEINEWLYIQLMGLSPYVNVVSPDHLKRGLVERLEQSLQRNSAENH